MTRLFLLVLLFGVINCRNRSPSVPVFDEEDSGEEFNEVFINIVDLFQEADAEMNKYGLNKNNAIDLYTNEEYKRIYSFENCYQNSLQVRAIRRVLKVSAPCQTPGGNLRDIVILPDNLQTHFLTHNVDRAKSKLIITIPFVKNDVFLDYDEFYPDVNVVQFLR